MGVKEGATLELQSSCYTTHTRGNCVRLLKLLQLVHYVEMVTFAFLCISLRWPEGAQEEVSVLEVPDQGAGEGVLFQRLHQQREASAALTDAQFDRSPGQNLVSEPADEGEETEQGPFTVLYCEPPAIKKTKTSKTVADTQPPSYKFT